jgi:hypothetical protein
MTAPNVTVTQNNQEIQTTLDVAGVPTGILQTGGQVFGQTLTIVQAASVIATTVPNLSTIPYVENGLTLPSSGASSAATVAAGSAWINNIRLLMLATPITLTANRDNYVDLVYSSTTYLGSYVVTSVALAAAAPALPANSLRLGFVKTGASTITSATTNAKDSLGNWMGNTSPQQVTSIYFGSPSQTLVVNSGTAIIFSGGELIDNAYGHSNTTNNTRFYALQDGMYSFVGGVQYSSGTGAIDYLSTWKNGVSAALGYATSVSASGATGAHGLTTAGNPPFLLKAGDYVELVGQITAGTQPVTQCWAALKREG